MTPEELERMWLGSICSASELKRILSTKNTSDHLLKLRAFSIIDHMRTYRVVWHRKERCAGEWSLTRSFSKKPFKRYLSLVNPEIRGRCQKIEAGMIFTNNPNGSCIRTDFGDLILVSNSLEYFLFYMNLAHLEFGVEVPEYIRAAAMKIAIRVMLKTETLDFELDPRGLIPRDIMEQNNRVISRQIQFIVGHEYAHYLKGHLDQSKTALHTLSVELPDDESRVIEQRFYTNSEQQEFEADELALKMVEDKAGAFKEMVYSSLMFFSYLDIYRNVSEQIYPSPPWMNRTHPEPMERFSNIYGSLGNTASVGHTRRDDIIERVKEAKEFLLQDVAENIEDYEMKGSLYLDAPETQWRGKKLIDRVDF